MRRLLVLPLVFAVGVVRVAIADPPKVIEVQLPPEEPTADMDPVTPTVEVPVEAADGRRGDGRHARREQRKMNGEAPTALFGVWQVVQVTELGETEDYRIKMERAGKALDEDCIITDTWFDFGPPPTEPGLPAEVTVTQVQRCEKGGLGTFSSETSLTTGAKWSSGEGTEVELPAVRADQQLIRLRVAEEAGRTPSNWVGPELRVDRDSVKYRVLAEYPPRRKGEGGRPVAVHLKTGNGVVWHLEPLGRN